MVAVDKFTKWIEAKPIKKLDASTAVKYVRDIPLVWPFAVWGLDTVGPFRTG